MKHLLLSICITGITLTISAQTNTYTYDQLGRITKVEYQDGSIEEIVYDSVGNRVSYSVITSQLPVELLDFTAYPAPDEKRKSIVEWTTISEINVAYFEVQHAIDAINFTPIGAVTAAGNSDTELLYRFKHHTPEYGVNYYRLITHDFDGTKSISQIATVTFAKDFTITLYPNPTKGITTLALNGEIGVPQRITVTDELGRAQSPTIIGTGENRWQLDTSSFIPGVYQVTFIFEREYHTVNLFVEPGQ